MTTPVELDSRQFRNALGSFTTGVTIVTTRSQAGQDIGLTVNSFNSLSLNPPMVLWSLAKTSLSLPAFSEAEYFAVHILAADQEPLSRLFAQPGADRFAGLRLERGLGGVPLLDGSAARFHCRTAFEYEGGDHLILVGEVITFDHFERPPLVFSGGRYAVAVKMSGDESTRPAPGTEPDSSFSRDFLGYLLGVAHYQLSQHVRRELERRGLREEEYLVLGLQGANDDRTVAEMDALGTFTGRQVTYGLVTGLAQRGLVGVDGPADRQARVRLTEDGRRVLIELTAVAKAAEADAEERLDFGERQLLKYLPRQVIRATDARLP